MRVVTQGHVNVHQSIEVFSQHFHLPTLAFMKFLFLAPRNLTGDFINSKF